ncbi:MAG: aldo/keto reductase [Saprospiraceae bacterium]|jgi:predicted aldo/keto reductase-like oxidoreductase|nr:aldo/keto reductase [Saprospiraceae bacterium]
MHERRDFLKQLAMVTGSLIPPVSVLGRPIQDKWGDTLPLRTLGKTNEKVTMLGVGGFHVGWTTERDAAEVIETAMEGGIRFFDTAESYNNGGSEIRYGKYLVPKYRDQVFIMSKSTAKNGKTAREHLEGSLKRMNCDYIDLWQVHSLQTPADVDARIENEVLDVFEKAKSEGKVRHIGFTGHQNPFAHKQMLDKTIDRDIFETIQMPINVIDSHFHSFIKHVLPLALERNLGILAMKTLSDGRFFKEKKRLDDIQWTSDDPLVPNYISIEEALYFVWSLPVSVLITGAENKEYLQEKIDLAVKLSNLSEDDRYQLISKVADKAGGDVEYYKKV